MAQAAQVLPEAVPTLRGIIAPWAKQLIAQETILQEAIRAHGSPTNIVCVSPFVENIEGFDGVLRDTVDSYRIMYARKPNKCRVFVKEAIERGIGLDISSEDELAETLRLGCSAERASVSAAVITESLAIQAIEHGVLTVVENEDQMALVEGIAAQKGRHHPVLIRVGGFASGEGACRSRLGFHPDAAEDVVRALAYDRYPNLDLRGFHFHINCYSVSPRCYAIDRVVGLFDCARALGLRPGIVDIGGGFPVNYLESGEEWAHFEVELRRALRGARDPVTWNNDGLGLLYTEGRFHGRLEVYPYFNETPKWLMLGELLHSRLSSGETVAQAINRRELQLRIEPGRALLDQCGISIAAVTHRSRDSAGDLCVGVSMNFTQLRSSSADFLVDPVLIPAEKGGSSTECFVSGNYCMDRDLIFKRKLSLHQYPVPGDLICFPNTAGYMMHFLESAGHGSTLAANLVFNEQENSLVFESRENE